MTLARRAVTAALSSLLVPAALVLPPPATAQATPKHTVTVSAGTGTLTQWPSYAARVDRFALVPSGDLNDSVVVTAGTSDPHGTVLVDGKPVKSGHAATVSGLTPGDEISVIIDDSAGHSAQSWIYLPSTFPVLSTTGSLDEGNKHVLLTLSNFLTTTPYEAVVDQHAVPTWFEQSNGSDLKPVKRGDTRYSLAAHADGGGYQIEELDRKLRVIRSHELDGIPASTDFHDSELLPGGRTLLLGYDGDTRDGHSYFDAVIQIVGRDGTADFTWNSKDHVDPSEAFVDGGTGDYAHVNALQYLPGSGDILASFRNLSQVMLIAGPDDPDHTPGDVIWRLGGQENQFTFLDDPYGGNCAQHMARLLPDGHLMLFDNGSRPDPTGPLGAQSGTMCPDPANPGGPAVARPQTRITEYKLNTSNPGNLRARLVWQFVPTNRYAAFAGSQQRLADGRTFVGWSQANHADGTPGAQPIASLVSPRGKERWKLFGGSWFSYRAAIGPAPDALRPEVSITSPLDGAVFQKGDRVRMHFTCTDTGGSGLDSCTGTVANRHLLPTSHRGEYTVKVTARDGAGNVKRMSVTYRVKR